ncbi:TPA: hypothetical protein ACPT24_006233, partial [Klebsiella pneumoniae]
VPGFGTLTPGCRYLVLSYSCPESIFLLHYSISEVENNYAEAFQGYSLTIYCIGFLSSIYISAK